MPEALTLIAAQAAEDFRRLNSGRALTEAEAETLVHHIAFKTTAGRAGAFTGQSVNAALSAALSAN